MYEELMKKTEIIVKEDVEHLLADLSMTTKKHLKANNIDYEIKRTRMTTYWDKMPSTAEWNLHCYCFKNLKISELTKTTDE